MTQLSAAPTDCPWISALPADIFWDYSLNTPLFCPLQFIIEIIHSFAKAM